MPFPPKKLSKMEKVSLLKKKMGKKSGMKPKPSIMQGNPYAKKQGAGGNQD